MRKTVLIVLILGLFQTSWANCPEDIQVISKGDIANCDGLLFSPEASKKADQAIQDSKYYKGLSDKLEERKTLADKENDILSKRLQLYVDQSQTLATQVTDDKYQKMIYFGLGVLATGLATYAAVQLTR